MYNHSLILFLYVIVICYYSLILLGHKLWLFVGFCLYFFSFFFLKKDTCCVGFSLLYGKCVILIENLFRSSNIAVEKQKAQSVSWKLKNPSEYTFQVKVIWRWLLTIKVFTEADKQDCCFRCNSSHILIYPMWLLNSFLMNGVERLTELIYLGCHCRTERAADIWL